MRGALAFGMGLGLPDAMPQFCSVPTSTFGAKAPSSHQQFNSSRYRSLGRHVFGPRMRVSFANNVPQKKLFHERRKVGVCRAAGAAEVEEAEENKEKKPAGRRRGSPFRCLSQIATDYNQIVILEAPEASSSQYSGSRVLLLDNSGNVHSIYKRDSAWTGFYWDEFASLPVVIPEGPVALFGLGGGTAARLLLKLWPFLQVEGYEIDGTLVEQARLHLGLSDLEIPTSEGGCLTVHVGDALSPSAAVDGGFAGIIVDLFSEGGVIKDLQKCAEQFREGIAETLPVEMQISCRCNNVENCSQAQTWVNLQKRLRPGGRIMVNCGGICVEKGDPKSNLDDGTWTWEDGGATKDATLLAMGAAFPGQLNWRKMDSEADNFLALSGPLPNLESWAEALPERLKEAITSWRPYT